MSSLFDDRMCPHQRSIAPHGRIAAGSFRAPTSESFSRTESVSAASCHAMRIFKATPLLMLFGLVSLGLASLSILDMYRPRPFDGIVLDPEAAGLVVREVVPGSGADLAGIERGDEILGIARELIYGNRRAAAAKLNSRRIGDEIPYYVRKAGANQRQEITVRLGRYQIGGGTYLYLCVVGLTFFFVGLFVLVRQPELHASRVFFVVCGLLLLMLVCRLRPASYSGIDTVVLRIGTLATLLLPAAFLHFYLVFPRAMWLRELAAHFVGWRRRAVRLLGWPLLYCLPLMVFALALAVERVLDRPVEHLAGLPVASWWLLTGYFLLGFVALRANARLLESRRERRGMALVFLGSVLGLVPFLVSVVSAQDSQRLLRFGVLPLVLVPVTFTYAIVRFQLLNIRIILRRSLLYTLTTVVVTGVYAFAIALFSNLFRGRAVALERYFPIILALAIVLLFEPLRRRLQKPVDQFFFAGQARLRQAIMNLGEELTRQVDPQEVVQELVAQLPKLTGLRFAALFQLRGDRLSRVAGPAELPIELPLLPRLQRLLQQRGRLTRLDRLIDLAPDAHDLVSLLRDLERHGVEAIGDLASGRRWIGLVVVSAKVGRIPLDREELSLLQGLLNQAALALETSLLLDERTQRAELERELEIAARIQDDIQPRHLRFAEGWRVAYKVRPARDVGGDFIAQLPGEDGGHAIVFGDVSGKSVSGALMMMAANEALHAFALADPRPTRLFELANQRLYGLGKRRFVALGYLSVTADGSSLRYLLAGQPPLILRRADGSVEELPLAEHRIPIGALPSGEYEPMEVDVAPGDVVVAYSDGITEAVSPTGEFFGSERLLDVVASATGGTQAIVEQVQDAIETFTNGATPYDDLTLVAVGRAWTSRPRGSRQATPLQARSDGDSEQQS